MSKSLTQPVRLFVPESFEGVMASIYMKYLMREQPDLLEVRFVSATNKFQFSDIEQYENVHTYLLGIPYRGEELSGAFYDMVDNPFEDFVHSATFGKKIENLDNQKSIVSESIDPCAVLDRMISKGHSVLSNFLTLDEFSSVLVKAVQEYRSWTWIQNQNHTTERFQVYYRLFGLRLADIPQCYDLDVLDKQFIEAYKAQKDMQQQQLRLSWERATRYELETSELNNIMVLYCLEDKNMVADYILERSQSQYSHIDNHVAVLLSPTRGSSDMATIRVRGNVDARTISQLISGKGPTGTSEASIAFIGGSCQEVMGNSIVALLENNDSNSDIITTRG